MQFTEELKALGKKDGTIEAHLVAISVVLDRAVLFKMLPVNPVSLLGRQGRPNRADAKDYPMPTWPEIKRLASRTESEIGEIILMLALTGCRQQEIVGLMRSQLNRDRDGGLSLSLKHTKNRRVRTVRLNGTARGIVERHIMSGPDHYLFRNRDGERFKAASSQYIAIRASLRREDPSFPLFRMHDLRHFWAVQALRNGMNIYSVSRNLGHSSVTTTETHYLRYLNNDDAHRVQREASLVEPSGSAYDPSDPLTFDALDETAAALPYKVGSGGSDQEGSE